MARAGSSSGSLHKALSHPLRTSILLTMQAKGTCSPNAFSAGTKGLGDDEVSLNVAAYHFRVLLNFEVIELAGTVPRRGATEHIYRINPDSPVPDLVRATQLLEEVANGSASGSDVALADAERVSILPVELDGLGQHELQELTTTFKTELAQISENCRRRNAESAEEHIAVRVGIATYLPRANGTPPPIAG